MRWILFWVVTAAFVAILIPTILAVFFGVGNLTNEERSKLFSAFLLETAVAVFALFYSLFGLQKASSHSAHSQIDALDNNNTERCQLSLISPKLPNAILLSRKDFSRMEHLILSANKDVYIVGINLDSAVLVLDTIIGKLKNGVSFRFLALDPCGTAIGPMSHLGNVDTEFRRSKIIGNLTHLTSKLSEQTINKWEIKVIDTVLPTGCVGVDLLSQDGFLIAQHYLFHTAADNSPILLLSRRLDEPWFKLYLTQLENLWVEAHPFVPSNIPIIHE